jgi:CheY-like chemotaxis protein
MPTNKVLIVDESSEIRTKIREMLPSGNFEILEAIDGEEAMLLLDLEGASLRLVIFNFNLPGVSGWDILKKLQTDANLQKIAVIATSDRADEIQVIVPQPYFEYIEVLENPCDRKTLQQAMKSAVGKTKLPRQPLPLEPLTSPARQNEPEPESFTPELQEFAEIAREPEELLVNSATPTPAIPSTQPTATELERVAVAAEAETNDTELEAAEESVAADPAEFAVSYTPYEYLDCYHIIGDRAAWGIGCLTISPDGQYFISGSETNPIKVWNLSTGTIEAQWNLFSQGTSCLTLTPDGQTTITGAEKTNIKLWNFYTGELLGPLNDHSSGVSAIAITPDSLTLISGALRSNIKLWDLQTGDLICPLSDRSFGTTALTLTPDGCTLITGFEQTNIKLWDLATGDLLGPLNIESSGVTSLIMSPDGQLVISGHNNGVIEFTDLYSGEVLRRIKAHYKPVNAVAITPDGQVVISVSDDEIKFWGAMY